MNPLRDGDVLSNTGLGLRLRQQVLSHTQVSVGLTQPLGDELPPDLIVLLHE